MPQERHNFFLVLKNCKNGTKISGKKKKKIPNWNKTAEIAIDANAATAVNNQPDHRMPFLLKTKIIF